MISAFNKERISLGIHKLFTDLKSLQLNQSELKILIFCLVALIVAKGSSLLPLTYDTDDYYFSIIPIIDETRGLIWVLGHGRFGSLIIYNFLISLGIYPTYVNIFAGFLSILSLVWMGIIICRLWGINNNILLGSLVVSMITLHPYTVGIFTYKILTYTIYFNFFLAFLGLYLIRSNVVGFLVGTILIIFSISDYQLIVNFLFLTICISFTITLLNNYGNRPFKLKEVLKNSKEILQIFALSLCAFLYFIINLIVQTFAKSPMVARGRLIGFGDIPTKLNEVKDIIIRVFFENEPIFPQATKIILLYIIFIAIFSVVIRIIGRKDTIQSKVLLLALTLVLIGASIIGIVGITIPLQMSWTTPRFLSSSGIFLGGLLAIGYSGLGGKLKTILLIFAFPVLF
ncbi:MAG TPA: hypothetical protein VMW42_04015, partial [Desulfatiglandales bacterium]|nr:hypothetical protein [Desulfatiglandales bacterium]